MAAAGDARMKRSIGAGEGLRRILGVLILLGVGTIALGLDTRVLARLSTAQTFAFEHRLARTLGMETEELTTRTGGTLPVEGVLPPLDGAVTWLNSPPLTREQLKGKVVLIDFWTYSCINCIRSVPYVRAWAEQYRKDGLVVIGGDGSLQIAHQFYLMGLPIVGVPKTIDNDIWGTTSCFGFDTAVAFAADAIDRLHTTAEAHRRIMVVEVMGRYAGWIALHAGVAGGADVILMPEIPYDLDRVVARIQERESFGARFSIVVVAEGAKPRGGDVTLIEGARAGHVERLGGIGAVVAKALQDKTRKETRHVVLGHLQRGGAPTAFDRVLATRFGGKAVELVTRGMFGRMVANHPPDIVPIPLADVVGKTKTVPLNYDLLHTARSIGVAFGD